jgi:hypothetical protein
MSKLHNLHTAHGQAMKALIIYDNFAFAAKANTMLQQAADQTDATIRWNIRPWRVDALNLTRNADEALMDAADAHLIVFAGHRAQSIPSWLQDWLERWVACRQIKDAAFAVIGGRNGETLSMPAVPELSRFAKRHGLSFITDEGFIIHDEERFQARSEPEDEGLSSLVHTRFMDTPSGHACRGWGIND